MSRLYLRSTTTQTAGYAATKKSVALPSAGASTTGSGGVNDLLTTKGAAQTSSGQASLAQTAHQDVYVRKFISEPLDVSQIDSGNWMIAIAADEANGAANSQIAISLYVLTSSDTVRGFIIDEGDVTSREFGNNPIWVMTQRSGGQVTGIQSTDRLCLEVWYHAVQSMNTSYLSSIYYNGTTEPVNDGDAASDAASYIDTAQTLFVEPANLNLSGASVSSGAFLVSVQVQISLNPSDAIATSEATLTIQTPIPFSAASASSGATLDLTVPASEASGFSGVLDDAAWYGVALSPEEIAEHYSSGAEISVVISTAPDRTRLSRVSGRDVITFGLTANRDYQAYKLKIVPDDSALHTEGVLIESGGSGSAGVERTVDVTDDELVAAEGAAVEGVKIVKAFVQDANGRWSDSGGVGNLLLAETMLSADTMLVAEGI